MKDFGATHDITELTEPVAKHNDFFAPVNEMDPHVKRKGITYDFDCQLFNMSNEDQRQLYNNVVKKCLNGEFIMGRKETNFTKDGDFHVYLEWMCEIKPTKVEGEVLAERIVTGRSETPVAKELSGDAETAEEPARDTFPEPTLPFETPSDIHSAIENMVEKRLESEFEGQ